MAKKIKPKSLLDDSASTGQNEISNDSSFEDKSLVGNGKITIEGKEKLEKYDALEKAVEELTSEKSVLQEKIEEYALKLDSLKDSSTKISSLEAEVKKLKNELKEAKDGDSEIFKLQKECKALRDEADGYLMKISELTFENANLTCQLEELGKKAANAGNIQNKSKFSPNSGNRTNPGGLSQPFRDAYNPYRNNGYKSW